MKDIPLYSSRLTRNYVDYLKKHYPDMRVDEILTFAGMTSYELEDEGHWFTQDQVDRFHDILVQKTGRSDIPRQVGRDSVFSAASGALRQYILGFVNPSAAYSFVEKINDSLSRGAALKMEKLGNEAIKAIATPRPGVAEKPYQCENRLGSLEALAKLFTGKYAQIEHPVCFHRGGDHCCYIIRWKSTPALLWKRFRNYSTVFFLLFCLSVLIYVHPIHWGVLILSCMALILGISLYVENREKRDLKLSLESQGDAAGRLLDQIDRRYNEALLVKEIGQATSMILNSDRLLHYVAETLEKRLDFDRGLIMMANEKKTCLIYSASYGYNPVNDTLKKLEFHLDRPESRGVAVEAFRNQVPYLINDVGEIEQSLSSRSLEFIRKIGSRSFICVPIVYEKESMGVLMVDNIESKRRLSQSDVNLLMGIAPQIAISLRNAISYDIIREREERFRSLSENSPDIIYTLGTDGAFAYVNPAWERIMGYRSEDVIGKYFINFAKQEDVRNYIRLFKMIRDERRTIRDDVGTLVHQDGSDRHFSLSGAPNLDAEGRVTGIVGTFKDITDLKRYQEELEKSFLKLKSTLDVTIQAISMIVEVRDPYTSGHQERVARLSTAIAREMGLSEEAITGIRMAALLHDIGKINVPAEILSKPMRLNDIESGMIKTHPRVGYNILKMIEFPFPVEKIVLQHHERMDGSGYPAGLAGDDIILEARILGVSDVVESMASHRPYRPALGIEAALAEISQKKGAFFDPLVVDACLKVFQEKEFRF